MKEKRFAIYKALLDGNISFQEADEQLSALFRTNRIVSEKEYKDVMNKAMQLWHSGDKIKAVKIVRKATGLRLKKCKEYCEQNFY